MRGIIERLSPIGNTLLVVFILITLPAGAQPASDEELVMRFVTGSDGHWRPGYVDYFTNNYRNFIDRIHAMDTVDLVVFNGDVVDRYAYIDWWNTEYPDSTLDDATSAFNIHWLEDVREIFDTLFPMYYVVQGNHDRASAAYWQEVWGYPPNVSFSMHAYTFVLLSRHDDRLVYLPVDYGWLDEVFTDNSGQAGIFLFMHAGDAGVMNDTFKDFISGYENIKGVFFGHNHRDRVEQHEGLYYFWNGWLVPIRELNGTFTGDPGFRVVEIYASGRIYTYFYDIIDDVRTNEVTIEGIATEVNGAEATVLPDRIVLSQNYPNPFNAQTRIGFALPDPARVRLSLYTVLGQPIATLTDEYREAGYHEVTFDASGIPSGVYLYRLNVDGFRSVRKLILMK
jgi:predicted phosphodiesterase